MSYIDKDELDGCELDFKEEPPVPNETVALMPLFAEALDPNSLVTVEDVEREWSEGVAPTGDF